MSKFKSKNDKELKGTDQATLDKTHRNIMNAFAKEEADLVVLTAESEILQGKINQNHKFKTSDEKNHAINTIETTKQQQTQFKKRKNKYLLDNSKLIFKYFNNKQQAETQSHTTASTSRGATTTVYGEKVLAFFNKKANATSEHGAHDHALNSVHVNSESNLVSTYLSNVDENYIHSNASLASSANNFCVYCKKGQLLVSDDDGYLVCDLCAASVTYIPENEKQSYKEPPKEVGTFLYQRSNHFKEIVAQFQAKETTYIADTVIEKCRLQIKKERLTNDQLTYYKMRELLRNLGYDSKLYEHIPFIKNKLGIPPPIFSRDLEMKLYKMFDETLIPFSKHQDDSRCNYIHYYFALYKMYELLGETRYAKDIPMLKEATIFMSQDEIWKNICRELNWKFIPTSFEIVGGVI